MHNHKTQPTIQILLVATLIALTLSCGAVGIARQVAEFGPIVGDMIMFDAAHPVGFDSDTRLTVARQGGGNCLLDAGVLQHSGGSLVLEQRAAAAGRLYLAHWAGPRTSDNPREDCGRDTDLVMSAADLGALAASAGGFWADHRLVRRAR